MPLRLTSRFVVLGLAVAVAVACSSANDEPSASTGVNARRCLPTKTSQTGFEVMGIKGDLVETAEYNDDHQLTQLTDEITVSSLLPKQTVVHTITYLSGRIEVATRLPMLAGSAGILTTYTQNSAGLITSISTVAVNSKIDPTTLITNAYNADGYLARQTDAQGNYSVFEYAGGNIASLKNYNKAGSLLLTQTFSYYTDRTLTVPILKAAIGAEGAFYAAGLLGKTIKNPIKQVTTTDLNGPTTDLSYTYDTNGNIASIEQKTTARSVSATSTTKYTYTCF
jgi:hypothetical protein